MTPETTEEIPNLDLLNRSIKDHEIKNGLLKEHRDLESKVAELSAENIDLSAYDEKVKYLTSERQGILADIALGTKTSDELKDVESRLSDAKRELSDQHVLRDNHQDIIEGLNKRSLEKLDAHHRHIKIANDSTRAYARAEAERIAAEYMESAEATLKSLSKLIPLMRKCAPGSYMDSRIPIFPIYPVELKAFAGASAKFERLHQDLFRD
jgi:hypothetical protein